MKFKKILSVLIASVVMLTALAVPAAAKGGSSPAMRDITTMELVRDMGIGINLGNTFEAFGGWLKTYGDGSVESYETAWGSPVITQKMIQGYAKEGFRTLRVPVHWFNLMDDNYNISKEYTSAVKQVVDWAADAGLYVIVNIHHDEDNFFADFATNKKDKQLAAYKKIWTQLAEVFRDYGDHLILESLNEEACWDSLWNRYAGNTGKAEAFALVNEINQTFVDVVRSSGGNNEKRHLLLAGYVTGIDETCDEMYKMPDDPANRCAVSIHYYMPSTFAILEEDADWGKARSTWGTSADFRELERYMNKMKTKLIDKGIPIILGEYGCPKTNKDPESVNLFLYSVCKAAYERNICPVLWDVTGLHYDRTSCKMYDSTLMKKLLSVLDNNAGTTTAATQTAAKLKTKISVGTGGDYASIADAVSAISTAINNKTADKAYTIVTAKGHTEKKAVTLPKSDVTFTLTGEKLTLTSPTITADSDLILSCETVSGKSDKAVTVKCGAGKKVTIKKAGSGTFALSGTKTSDFVLNTGSVINVSSAATANIKIGSKTTVKLTGGKFTPTVLSGSGTLDVYGASKVTVSEIKNSTVILNQYRKTSGNTASVKLPVLTVGTADKMKLTVKTTKGALANIKGKTVMYLSKASSESRLSGVTVTNTSGGKKLIAFPSGKKVKAVLSGNV